MNAAPQLVSPDISRFKMLLDDHGIPDTSEIQVRLAYFDRVKKRYSNSCHRVQIELKAIKRIRPVFIDGKKLFKVFLNESGANEAARFPKERPLHGNNVLSLIPESLQNASESFTKPKTVHDKKDSCVDESSIEEVMISPNECTVRNTTDTFSQVSTSEFLSFNSTHSKKLIGKSKHEPDLRGFFFTFEDISQKVTKR